MNSKLQYLSVRNMLKPVEDLESPTPANDKDCGQENTGNKTYGFPVHDADKEIKEKSMLQKIKDQLKEKMKKGHILSKVYSSQDTINEEEPGGWDEESTDDDGASEADENDDKNTSNSGVFHQLTGLPYLELKTECLYFAKYVFMGLLSFLIGLSMKYVHGCVAIKGQCVFTWSILISIMIGSYPIISISVKLFVLLICQTRFIHLNRVYFFVRLHYLVAQILWAVFIYILYRYDGIGEHWFINFDQKLSERLIQILGCFVAYKIIYLLNSISLLELANRYMWQPYMERLQANIFAQHVILILTDYALGYTRNNSDQQVVLQFSKNEGKWHQMSMYAIGKALSFIPQSELNHSLISNKQRAATMDSKKSTKIFSDLLFDRLVGESEVLANEIEEKPCRIPSLSTFPTDTSAEIKDLELLGNNQKEEKPLRRSSAAKVVLGVIKENETHRELKRTGSNFTLETFLGKGSKVSPKQELASIFSSKLSKGLSKHGFDNRSTATHGGNKRSSIASQQQGSTKNLMLFEMEKKNRADEINDAFDDTDGKDSAMLSDLEAAHHNKMMQKRNADNRSLIENESEHVGVRVPEDVTSDAKLATAGAEVLSDMESKKLKLWMLRSVMIKPLAVKTIALLGGEECPDGEITRKIFQNSMIKLYQQKKSLALTLKDYEVIIIKLGFIISLCWTFVGLFACLKIFRYNVFNLGVTWASLLVGFGFLFGSSATNLFESCIFIFVTRAYDVGDRVYIRDELNVEANYVVQRINMLTTVFKRLDEQYAIMPNQQLAKREIRNQKRSGSGSTAIPLHVSLCTPKETLEKIKSEMKDYATSVTGPLYGCNPDSVDYICKGILSCSNMDLIFCYSQKSSFQDHYIKSRNLHNMTFRLSELCHEYKLKFTMPSLPVEFKNLGNGTISSNVND